MIVVSDTSVLTALLTIGQADLLPTLFGQVVVPHAVRDELLRSQSTLPNWLRVVAVQNREEALRLATRVDEGEAEAIELAKELRADRLLIDERKGRKLAEEEGVPVIGLLGALLLAKRRQIIPSARTILLRLEIDAGIYLSRAIRDQALKSVGE